MNTHYSVLRSKGLRSRIAWAMAGLPSLEQILEFIDRVVVALLICGFFLILMSYLDDQYTKKHSALKAENQQLSAIVQKCLGEKEGALMIGGELYLCRAIPTGVR